MKKLFRVTTVPMSLNILLKGQLRYLNHYYQVTAISSSGRELLEVQDREGVETQAIEISRSISPLKDIISLYQLYRYFKREKPDIVHSITPKAGLLSMIAGKFAGVPIRMHTFTGLIFPSKNNGFKMLLIWMDRLLSHCATHIYPEGKGVQENLEKYKITQKPLKIIGNGNVNGIDLNHFNLSHISKEVQDNLKMEMGIKPNDFVFIFVGRLVRDKGINELVTAFNLMNRKFNNQDPEANQSVKLLLVGELEQDLDPLEAVTLQQIQSNTHIISVGFQQDVRPYFAVSNVLVFPSYREGFPNVVLQSLALEVPAIVTNICGSSEMITRNENGLIVPVKSAALLAEAMEKLIFNPNLLFNLKSNSRASVQPFEQQMLWEALRKEYQRVDNCR